MLTREEAQKVCDVLLNLSAADEVVISLADSTSTHVRFARNGVTTSGTSTDPEVSITSTFGSRSGTASGNQFDPESLEAVMRRSEEVARLAPEDPEHMPVLGPQSYPEVPLADPPAVEREHEMMIDGVARSISDASKRKLVAAGFTESVTSVRSLASSAGLFAFHRSSRAHMSQTVRTPDGRGSGWAGQNGAGMGDLDFARASQTAMDKAALSVEPREIEPGKYPAILEPTCVAALAGRLLSAMDARRADEGRSYFSGKGGKSRVGERLFPRLIDIRTDPTDARLPASPFAGGGLPQTPRAWIDGGKVANLFCERFWARKSGREPMPGPGNLIMAGGKGDLASLIKGMKKGLLVTSLWYIRSVDPQSLLYTGLTRDGVFWIENGAIAYPVKNFRWNDSPIALFKAVEALSESVVVPPRGSRSGTVAPAMRVKSFTLDSVSDAV